MVWLLPLNEDDMKAFASKLALFLTFMIGPGMIGGIIAQPPPPPPPVTGAPIDSLVISLLVLSVIYGSIKLFGKRKAVA